MLKQIYHVMLLQKSLLNALFCLRMKWMNLGKVVLYFSVKVFIFMMMYTG